MRTIGYFDPSSGAGGTTRYLLELLSGLDRSQYRPVVFAPDPAGWHADARAVGAEIVLGVAPATPPHQLHRTEAAGRPATPAVPRRARPWTGLARTARWELGLLRDTNELATLFRRAPVDLLHSNVAGDEVAPIAARRAGMPRVIATLHVDPTYDIFGERSGPRHVRLQRRSLRALDLAIAVSEQTAIDWRAHLGLKADNPPPMRVVPSGIRLDRLVRRRPTAAAKEALGLPADALVIGSVGRLDWAKGYGDLIAALPLVLTAAPTGHFAHAGTGPLAERLAVEAARLGVAGRVHWLGFRSDVRDLLEACDLYVQPSWCETQGLAVLEAGALGLPVVASTAGGLPESLDHGQAGRLVPPRDPVRLAEALVNLLGSSELRAQLGRALQARVRQRYTTDRMVDATMRLYDELLNCTPAAMVAR